jgi:tRNA nucleotidyltransferase (CCA-adding enzyme)
VPHVRLNGLLRILFFAAAFSLFAAPLPAQDSPDEQEVKLPSGKSQRDAILKAEHEKTLRDIGQIQKLADELKTELEKNDYHVLSIALLKKTEEIEKLARQVRSRMKR